MDGFSSSESSPRRPFVAVLNPVFKSHGAHKQSGVAASRSLTPANVRHAPTQPPPPSVASYGLAAVRSSLAIDRSPAQLRTRRSRRAVPLRPAATFTFLRLPHATAFPRAASHAHDRLDARSIDRRPPPSPLRIDYPSSPPPPPAPVPLREHSDVWTFVILQILGRGEASRDITSFSEVSIPTKIMRSRGTCV